MLTPNLQLSLSQPNIDHIKGTGQYHHLALQMQSNSFTDSEKLQEEIEQIEQEERDLAEQLELVRRGSQNEESRRSCKPVEKKPRLPKVKNAK